MEGKKHKDVYLQVITMINLAIGWIAINSVPEARAYLVANEIELAWLTRYSLHNKIIGNRGREFLDKFKVMVANEYRIPCNSISLRSPQANAIVESVHHKWKY